MYTNNVSPRREDGIPDGTEMHVFLPHDGTNVKDGVTNKYRVTVAPTNHENEYLNHVDGKDWDPFQERKLDHPTSDCETLTHMLKAALGSGILAMPFAFKNAGLTVGVLATVLVAVVCTHCAYILVKCAHVLYHRTRTTAMTFPDVGEVAFANGPPWGRKYARLARLTIQVGLFLTYFGTCSVYTVIVGNSFQQVIQHYTGVHLDNRFYIGALLIPLILIGWVPNLKYLAPVSMLANLFMGVGLIITVYYLVQDIPSFSERDQYEPLIQLPQLLSIVIFAMEAIGVVMPLENNMRTPRHFLGLGGVLNQGMAGVCLVYILVGFLGYLKYGDATDASITLNLPNDEIAAQSVKILIALAVFCTYGLQYYVCLEIIWNAVKDRYTKNARFMEYVVRTVLVTSQVALAVAVPTIGPFIALIGALFFSILGLVIPALIEIVTYWEHGLGPCRWLLWKNFLMIAFGVIALLSGSYTSILAIIDEYTKGPPGPLNGTLADLANDSSIFDNVTEDSITTTWLPET